MDEKSLVLATNAPIALSSDILSKLETYEDYLSFYIQLDQASSAFAWLKADLLLQMSQKLGDKSLEQLGIDLNEKRSTVINYVRTAKAFPADKRDEAASFSIHFRASFADSFDDKTQEFNGEKRFKWVEKAVDEGLSTRELAEAIHSEKQRESLNIPILPCSRCGKTEGKIFHYVLYAPGEKRLADRFELHEECYVEFVAFGNAYQNNNH